MRPRDAPLPGELDKPKAGAAEVGLDVQDSPTTLGAAMHEKSVSFTTGHRKKLGAFDCNQWSLRLLWGGSKYSGVACMVLSSAAYSFMGLLVKLLAVQSIPSSQTVMVRCGVISVLSWFGLRRMNHPLLGSQNVRRLVLARAVIGFVSLSTYFYSIQVLPLRDATVLNFTTPVFTAVFATYFLKEPWGSFEMAGSLSSFIGVLLITQPEILFSGNTEKDDKKWITFLGTSVALVAASTGALSYIVVRAIGKQGEPPLVSVFAYAAFSTPSALLAMLFQGAKLPNTLELAELLSVGLTAYAAQVFLSRGLQLEKAARAASVQYVKVLLTYLLGVFFLRETPSISGMVGALLITISAIILSKKGGS